MDHRLRAIAMGINLQKSWYSMVQIIGVRGLNPAKKESLRSGEIFISKDPMLMGKPCIRSGGMPWKGSGDKTQIREGDG